MASSRKYDGGSDPDYAAEVTQEMTDAAVSGIRAKAHIPPGKPGDCDLCGEHSQRLIRGACAPCRDKWKLP